METHIVWIRLAAKYAARSGVASSGSGVSRYWASTLRLLRCMAITLGLVFLPNGGVINSSAAPSPHSLPALPKVPAAESVQCPTARLCVVVGIGVARSTDGGRTWTTIIPVLPARPGVYSSVSCPSPMHCEAAGLEGAIGRSTDGGRTWSVQTSLIPDASVRTISSVNCPSATVCFAWGEDEDGDDYLLRSIDAGLKWSASPLFVAPQVLSCISTTQCVGVSIGIIRTTDGGKTWSTQYNNPHEFLDSVQCLPAGWCVAVGIGVKSDGDIDGSVILHSTDGGRTWISRHFDTFLGYKGVSCSSAHQCVAVNEDGIISTSNDGARTWSSQTIASSFSLEGVSCPTATLCVAVGSTGFSKYGFILRSVDGGRTWSRVA